MNLHHVRGPFSPPPMPYLTGPRHPVQRLWVRVPGEVKAHLYEVRATINQALAEGRRLGRALVEVK